MTTHAINGAPICPHCRVIGSHDGGCPRAGCTCGHVRRFHRGPEGDGYQCDSCYNDSRGPGFAHAFELAPVVSHQPGCSCDGSLDFREADWTIAREAEVSFLNLGKHTSFCRFNAVTPCTCYVADYIAALAAPATAQRDAAVDILRRLVAAGDGADRHGGSPYASEAVLRDFLPVARALLASIDGDTPDD